MPETGACIGSDRFYVEDLNNRLIGVFVRLVIVNSFYNTSSQLLCHCVLRKGSAKDEMTRSF